MEKTLVRLGQIEGMLITSRPVGGLPETAREQLEKFMVSMQEIMFAIEETVKVENGSRSVCNNHSYEYVLTYSEEFSILEAKTSSYWHNQMFYLIRYQTPHLEGLVVNISES